MTAPDDALAAIEAHGVQSADDALAMADAILDPENDGVEWLMQHGCDVMNHLRAEVRSLRAHIAGEPDRVAAAVAGERARAVAAVLARIVDADERSAATGTLPSVYARIIVEDCARAIDADAIAATGGGE